ncbi:hypothetical protein CROQUDRAFT_664402 [Cronartium quercuum f. sp. fusiforme G11]|uniref:Uncharacterized protein n=1 Tax=Cronartium quercuum f. sp. fusiforme G11 TaxID=708437 RepID=A0A9P6N710_9BASI|nr:hypothetical protein CROQUDRAFT_664402 [Cronartium quercuum f. sp. fusiforme G11]
MSSIPNSNAISPKIQAVISAALAAQDQVYKGTIAQLERCFENMPHFCSQAGSEAAPSHLNIKSHTPASPATPKGSGSSSKPLTPSHKAPSTGPIKK